MISGWRESAQLGLAVLWLIVPAIQYLGAYMRTQWMTGSAEGVSALGTVDLSPWYVLLLAVSLAFLAVRFAAARSARPAGELK